MCFLQEDLKLEAKLQVSSDATGSLGFGVYFRGRWCPGDWLEHWVTAGIPSNLPFLDFSQFEWPSGFGGLTWLTAQCTFGRPSMSSTLCLLGPTG